MFVKQTHTDVTVNAHPLSFSPQQVHDFNKTQFATLMHLTQATTFSHYIVSAEAVAFSTSADI